MFLKQLPLVALHTKKQQIAFYKDNPDHCHVFNVTLFQYV